jgi:hypothetical protein
MNRNVKKECGVLTSNADLQTLVHTASSFTTGQAITLFNKDLAT